MGKTHCSEIIAGGSHVLSQEQVTKGLETVKKTKDIQIKGRKLWLTDRILRKNHEYTTAFSITRGKNLGKIQTRLFIIDGRVDVSVRDGKCNSRIEVDRKLVSRLAVLCQLVTSCARLVR